MKCDKSTVPVNLSLQITSGINDGNIDANKEDCENDSFRPHNHEDDFHCTYTSEDVDATDPYTTTGIEREAPTDGTPPRYNSANRSANESGGHREVDDKASAEKAMISAKVEPMGPEASRAPIMDDLPYDPIERRREQKRRWNKAFRDRDKARREAEGIAIKGRTGRPEKSLPAVMIGDTIGSDKSDAAEAKADAASPAMNHLDAANLHNDTLTTAATPMVSAPQSTADNQTSHARQSLAASMPSYGTPAYAAWREKLSDEDRQIVDSAAAEVEAYEAATNGKGTVSTAQADDDPDITAVDPDGFPADYQDESYF